MSALQRTETPDRAGERIGGLRRETRESAALILVALAVVLTVSFIGLAIG
jgi:hypothetical protein